jgi:CRP-like cAMP-binding protein
MEKSEELTKQYMKMLDSVEILQCLAEEELKDLANAFVEMTFMKGDVIAKEGEPGKTFYMLYEGEVLVTKDGAKIRAMKSGEFFGEKALLSDEPRSATVTVTSEKVIALALDKESFDLLLGPLADLLKEYQGNKTSTRQRAKSIAPRSTMMAPPKKLRHVAYEDLDKVGLLGNGGFGCVELMKNKKSGETYALKSMSKGHIVKVGMQAAVVNEKNVLLIADSPFIVKLYATYNFESTVCFLLELLLGGELYATYTRENFWGSEVHAKFYAAIVILAFEHLHSHRILYRDLKPENIVLNKNGMPKLVDMGLAKRVVGKTHTTCGTPDYFAPEVITAGGHNHAVDWWTVGILVFELLSGNPPFTAGAPMQIFKNVLGGIKKVALPKKCQGDAGHLIKALLRKEPSERLPMRNGGVVNVKQHQWYAKFDWPLLEKAEMKVPYRPTVKSDTDMKNFSAREEDIPRPVTYHDDGSGWDIEFEIA